MFYRRSKVLRVMGLLALHCTELGEDTPVSEVWNTDTHTQTHTHTHRCCCYVNVNFMFSLCVEMS